MKELSFLKREKNSLTIFSVFFSIFLFGHILNYLLNVDTEIVFKFNAYFNITLCLALLIEVLKKFNLISFTGLSSLATFFYLTLGPLGKKVSFSWYLPEVYLESNVIISFALFAMYLTSIFTKKDEEQEIPITQIKSNLYIPIIAYTVLGLGYMLIHLQYLNVGGFLNAFKLDRTVRIGLFASSKGNYPFELFFIWSTTLINLHIFSKNTLKKILLNINLYIFPILIGPVVLLWLLEGERSTLIMIALSILSILIIRFPKVLKAKILAPFFILSFISLAFIGNFRGYVLNAIKKDDISIVKEGIKEFEPGWLFPREFSANYFSFTTYVYLEPDLRFGETYINSLIQSVPRRLFGDFTKPPALSHEFGTQVRKIVHRDENFGVGMSSAAEAYLNFGKLGPAIIISLWLLLMMNFDILKTKVNDILIRNYLHCLIPSAWFYYRTPFSTQFNFFTRMFAIFVFSFLLYKLLTKTRLNYYFEKYLTKFHMVLSR